MRNILAWPDWSDQATITGSTAQAGAPLANLQKKQPKQVWASSSLSSVYMELDRGSAQTFNAVALLFANATSNATWRVRAASSQANLSLPGGPGYEFGAALDFNGSTQHAEWTGASATGLTGYSLGLRLRADTLRVQGIARATDGTDYMSIQMDASNKIAAAFYGFSSLTSATSVVASTWMHVFVVVSGTNYYLYINGVLEASGTGASSRDVNEIDLAHTVTNRFDGRVDDVQFYTRALTAAEVLADFEHAGTRTTPATGLHSYYTFDGTNANAGSAGGTMTYTAGPVYVTGARFTASPWSRLDDQARRHALLWLPTGVSYRWLRIDIDDPLNADAAIEAGRLVVANAWQFVQTYPGGLPSFEDSTQVEVLPGGQSAINAGTPIPITSVKVLASTEAELMDNAHELSRRRGASGDVLYVRDPDPASVYREHGLCYGLMRVPPLLNLPEYGRFEASVEIRGLL